MTLLRLATLAFAGILYLSPSVAHAQVRDTSLASVLREVQRRGQYVRLSVSPDVAGRVTSISGDIVRMPGSRIPMMDIQSVEVRSTSGGGVRAGAITGAGVVALATMMVAAPTVGLDVQTIIGSVITGMIIGGPVGGIAGRLLSPPTTRWDVIWPDASLR